MTLTEQWKKGELESSQQYYVEYVDGRTGKANLIETPDFYGFYNNCSLQDYVKEVLAPVPTYEEWKNVITCFDYEHKAYLSMSEENQQLREWCEEFNALDVAKENQQLKELLDSSLETNKALAHRLNICKELLITCKYCVATLKSKGVSDCNGVKLSGLLTKVDEVLK